MSDSIGQRAAAVAAAIAGAAGVAIDAEARGHRPDGDWEPRLDRDRFYDQETGKPNLIVDIWDGPNPDGGGGGGGGGGAGGGGGNLNWFPFS